MTPAEELTRALLDLATNGERPRCGDPETHALWLSDDHEERKLAATWCDGCPILQPCAEAGAAEAFGVWGAVDRTVSARKVRR